MINEPPRSLYVFGIDIGGKFCICFGQPPQGGIMPLIYTTEEEAIATKPFIQDLVEKNNVNIELIKFDYKEILQVFSAKARAAN